MNTAETTTSLRSEQELTAFYNKTLLPVLETLEKDRKRAVTAVLITLAVLAPLNLLALIPLLRGGDSAQVPLMFVLAVVDMFIVSAVYLVASAGFKRNFKEMVIQPLIEFVSPGLSYEPKSYIRKDTFLLSKLFSLRPNRYKGDDHVRGMVGATRVEFCELHAKHESGSGKNRTVTPIFDGLFFIADFNKDFSKQTIVLPDTAEKLFGGLGKKLQEWNLSRPKLVKLEDPEFEREFVVYGDDQIEARYILSPSLMRRILDFKAKTGGKIYLSFIGSMLFLAVPYKRMLFEPKLFKSLVNFDSIREYYGDLALAVGIVDDLNLNTRIWSKE